MHCWLFTCHSWHFCKYFWFSHDPNHICRDLNPLHDVINETHYKEKYYKNLIPLGVKYSEVCWLSTSLSCVCYIGLDKLSRAFFFIWRAFSSFARRRDRVSLCPTFLGRTKKLNFMSHRHRCHANACEMQYNLSYPVYNKWALKIIRLHAAFAMGRKTH